MKTWSPPSEDNRSPEFAPWWKKERMRWLLGSSAFSPSCREYISNIMEGLKDNSFHGGGGCYSKLWQSLQWRGVSCDKEKVGPEWAWWPGWLGKPRWPEWPELTGMTSICKKISFCSDHLKNLWLGKRRSAPTWWEAGCGWARVCSRTQHKWRKIELHFDSIQIVARPPGLIVQNYGIETGL